MARETETQWKNTTSLPENTQTILSHCLRKRCYIILLELKVYTIMQQHHSFIYNSQVSKMLPAKFQEEVVFLYYDTYRHEKEEPTRAEREHSYDAKKAQRLLWEYLNTAKLPESLCEELKLLYKMRTALKDAADPKVAEKLKNKIKKQKEKVEEQRE